MVLNWFRLRSIQESTKHIYCNLENNNTASVHVHVEGNNSCEFRHQLTLAAPFTAFHF